jgi:iron complex transport system substrate-binding protein
MGPTIPVLVCALLIFGACGSEPEGGTQPAAQAGEDSGFPVTVTTSGGTVSLETQPQRIVSLSATATEMLFAVDAGDQVVAVDDQSNFPKEAPTTSLSGYEPNIEAIAGYEPDLVVASDATVRRPLKRLAIPVLVQPAAVDLEDTYEQIEQLGAATGHVDEAAEEVARIQTEIEGIVSSIPKLEEELTYFHELDDTYFSVTSETFIGQVYDLVGLKNIADEAKGAGTGYPQLSAEYIIQADPDLIFLADTKCCDQSGATVAKRPGWNQIAAVENDAVIELDDDIASRWGPRVVDYLRIVAEAIREVAPATT